LEEALELEEETSECHLETLEVAKQWRIWQSKEKDDNLKKVWKYCGMEKLFSSKQLQELPSLPKKVRKFKQAKAITREKFIILY